MSVCVLSLLLFYISCTILDVSGEKMSLSFVHRIRRLFLNSSETQFNMFLTSHSVPHPLLTVSIDMYAHYTHTHLHTLPLSPSIFISVYFLLTYFISRPLCVCVCK